jgi:hypothetical protein
MMILVVTTCQKDEVGLSRQEINATAYAQLRGLLACG